MCTKSLMPEISKLHAGAAANVQTAADGADKADNGAPDNREGLKAQIMDRNSWMGYMTNSAIEEGFHVLDVAVKKVSNSGTTATVLLLRE